MVTTFNINCKKYPTNVARGTNTKWDRSFRLLWYTCKNKVELARLRCPKQPSHNYETSENDEWILCSGHWFLEGEQWWKRPRKTENQNTMLDLRMMNILTFKLWKTTISFFSVWNWKLFSISVGFLFSDLIRIAIPLYWV